VSNFIDTYLYLVTVLYDDDVYFVLNQHLEIQISKGRGLESD